MKSNNNINLLTNSFAFTMKYRVLYIIKKTPRRNIWQMENEQDNKEQELSLENQLLTANSESLELDIIRKHSGSHYVEPEFVELYSFSEKQIQKYCEWVKEQYTAIVKTWDVEKNTFWTAKYYLATKFLYMTNLLAESLDYSKENNLKITIPYLIYYSLLTASRSLIYTSPIDNLPLDEKRTHENIINVTADIIAKISKDESNAYKDTINTAKENRELYSYKFPASGLSLINDNSDKVSKQIKLIKELAILNSQILDVKLNKIKDKSVFEIDGTCNSVFYNLFEFNDKLDNDDYYNSGYIARKIKRPQPLNFMISEGIEEDLSFPWEPEEEIDGVFVPPLYIFN